MKYNFPAIRLKVAAAVFLVLITFTVLARRFFQPPSTDRSDRTNSSDSAEMTETNTVRETDARQTQLAVPNKVPKEGAETASGSYNSTQGVAFAPLASLTMPEQIDAFEREANAVAKIPFIEKWVAERAIDALPLLLSHVEESDPYLKGAVLTARGELGRVESNPTMKMKVFVSLFGVLRRGALAPRPAGLADALIACDSIAQLGVTGPNDKSFAELAKLDSIPPDLALKLLEVARAVARPDTPEIVETLKTRVANPQSTSFRHIEPEMKEALLHALGN